MACSTPSGMSELVKSSQSHRLQGLLCLLLGLAIAGAAVRPSALRDDAMEFRSSFTLAESDFSTPLVTSAHAVNEVLSETTSFQSLAAYDQHTTWYRTAGGEAFDANLTRFAGNIFGAVGAKNVVTAPVETLSTDLPGIYLSESFWKEKLGADARWIGGVMHLYQIPHRVLGVVRTAHPMFADTEIWQPITRSAPYAAIGSLRVVGLLAEGIDWNQAAADLTSAVRRIARAQPNLFDSICKIVPVSEKLIMRPAPEETAANRLRGRPLLDQANPGPNAAS